jgi:hypothetical protein
MKRCGYCGKDNDDSSLNCGDCGTAFSSNAPDPDALLGQESWGRVRAQGRGRFVLRRIWRTFWVGAVLWMGGRTILAAFTRVHLLAIWEELIICALIAVSGGGLLALNQWDDNEEHYQRANEDRGNR